MGCTVSELSVRMSAAEFGRWRAFWAEEPIGPNASLGMLAAVLAALANGPLKPPSRNELWKASHFAANPWAADPEPDTEEAFLARVSKLKH